MSKSGIILIKRWLGILKNSSKDIVRLSNFYVYFISGQKLLDSLAETWDFFFCDVLSMLQAIFYPVQVCRFLQTFPGFWQPRRVDCSVSASLGKGAICPSAGASPLPEHHRSQLEAGWGSVPTSSTSPSLHHSDAANTTGKDLSSLCVCVFLCICLFFEARDSLWGKVWDPTGNHLSVNTELSSHDPLCLCELPMFTV